MSYLDDLPLAKDADGFPIEVSGIDSAFGVQFRLYEPMSQTVGNDVVYTHVIDLDVAREQDAEDWMHAYTIRILASEFGDHRRDPVRKQRYHDRANWAVANAKYETVRDDKGFTFMRMTFTDNPPAHLVIT